MSDTLSDATDEGRAPHEKAVSEPLPVSEEALRAYLRDRVRGLEVSFDLRPETRMRDVDPLDRHRYVEYRALLDLAAAFGIEVRP